VKEGGMKKATKKTTKRSKGLRKPKKLEAQKPLTVTHDPFSINKLQDAASPKLF
jgi:hypothetical protein